MNSATTVQDKILVTGGAGLLGRELILKLLADGNAVTSIYNRQPLNIDHPLLTVIQCDILDVIKLEEVMQGTAQVYHCAAKVSFARADLETLYKVNVEGTANIVNAALDAGIKKMVHVSSVAALGRIRENVLIDETMSWTEETSNSKYGQSKYMGELEVWRGIAEGLDAVIVNPTIILGDGNWEDGSTEIFKSAYDEFPWIADGTTGFVDAKDVAIAMIMLMDSDISAQRFIISAENKSYGEVFNKIADSFNKKRPTKKVTPLLAAIVWRWGVLKSVFTGKIPLVTKETAATALTKASFDNSKMKKWLPSFSYRSLDETITTTCAALQQKLNIR